MFVVISGSSRADDACCSGCQYCNDVLRKSYEAKNLDRISKMVPVGSGKLCSDACQTIHACCTVMLGESCGMIMRF